MNPFGVDRRIEALDVAPSSLPIGVGLIIGTKTYAHDIVRSKYVFDGFCDNGLRLALREVVGNQCRTNAELRRVANSPLPCDTYL